MATTKQHQAAKKNIKKAQSRRRSMSSRQHSRAQPEGGDRKGPGAGGGNFYRVEVRPKEEFVTFRTQDVGGKGHIERVAGKRASGSWATAAWLIGKEDAHIAGQKLVADSRDAKELLKKLGSEPVHRSGDRFDAKDRPNVPERAKPTAAQRRARSTNIKKAQAARRKRSTPSKSGSHR
ncbi:MAG TPA: hypothetical protein VMJ64_02755 [Anaerolineales bacterium]|nr:hypothetical protein [Anaerolineales bacterium]